MKAVPNLEEGRRGGVSPEDAVPNRQHIQGLLHSGVRRAESSQTGDNLPGRHGEVIGLELYRIFEAEVRIFAKDLGYSPIAVRGVPFEADLFSSWG